MGADHATLHNRAELFGLIDIDWLLAADGTATVALEQDAPASPWDASVLVHHARNLAQGVTFARRNDAGRRTAGLRDWRRLLLVLQRAVGRAHRRDHGGYVRRATITMTFSGVTVQVRAIVDGWNGGHLEPSFTGVFRFDDFCSF